MHDLKTMCSLSGRIVALSVLLHAFASANPASSASGAATHQRDAGMPAKKIGWSRLYPASDHCAEAKVDIWLERGIGSYGLSLSATGSGSRRAAVRVGGGIDGTTMLIGDKDCLIRVRIERAPAGATLED